MVRVKRRMARTIPLRGYLAEVRLRRFTLSASVTAAWSSMTSNSGNTSSVTLSSAFRRLRFVFDVAVALGIGVAVALDRIGVETVVAVSDVEGEGSPYVSKALRSDGNRT